MNLSGWLGLALVVALALFGVSSMDSKLDLEKQHSAGLQQRLGDSALRVTEQAAVIQSQQAAMADATEASRLFSTLTQTIQRDGKATRQTLAEIKAHDQAVADYLRSPVPAAYGVQFTRPATTDPAAYRYSGSLPAGGVPAASTGADPRQ